MAVLIISIQFGQFSQINGHNHPIEGTLDQPSQSVELEASDVSEDFDKI